MIKVLADENIPYVKEAFSQFGEVRTISGRKITPDTLEDAQVLLVRSITKVNEDLLKKSKVRFVATATIGFDHIDTAYLERKGIGFSSAPGSNATSVAEYIVSALLNLAKKYRFNLAEKTIGIIGVGNVGGRIEARLSAINMKVILNDPPLFDITHDEKYRPLEEVLKCDIITCHTPLTKDGPYPTYHLVNDDFFSKTNKGLIFLNTSRGAVADTSAVLKHIKSGHISASVFDVFESEPDINTELLERIDIGTPHIAGYSFDGKVRGTEMIYRAAAAFFKLESQWRIELPVPQVPIISIDPSQKTGDDALRAAVLPVYDVMEDDKRLRGIFALQPSEQGAYFDKLRKEYPVRREFANTRINLSKKAPELARKLTTLEFMLED